eukprot:s3612_g10.t1
MESEKPPCRLVAVDGNGTLLGADGTTISEYTRSVISKIEAKGIPVVLATGRPFEKVLQCIALTPYYCERSHGSEKRAIEGLNDIPHPDVWLACNSSCKLSNSSFKPWRAQWQSTVQELKLQFMSNGLLQHARFAIMIDVSPEYQD